MIRVNPSQLLRILPRAGGAAAMFAEPINAAMAEWGIDDANECASFLAQVGHESAHLTQLEENLNYSQRGLMATWPKRFPADVAARYARRPEAIANMVYANRLGNGDEASGDGWRFRGRGLIQCTGRNNYTLCGEALDLPLLQNPQLLLDPVNAARSAGWYWQIAGLDRFDDDDDAGDETRRVNGGANGMAERQEILNRALEILA